jgi:hypothetical protein
MADKKKGFDTSTWDGSGVKSSLSVESLRKVCVLDLNGYPGQEDGPVKDLCYLPIKSTPGGSPNAGAVKAAGAGPRSISRVKKPANVPQDYFVRKRKSAAGKLVSLWERAFDNKAPISLYKMAGMSRAAESMMPRDSNELEDIITSVVIERERTLRSEIRAALAREFGAEHLEERIATAVSEAVRKSQLPNVITVPGTIGWRWTGPTGETQSSEFVSTEITLSDNTTSEGEEEE